VPALLDTFAGAAESGPSGGLALLYGEALVSLLAMGKSDMI